MKPVLISLAMLLGTATTVQADITIFAAASLKTALDEIASDWAEETGEDYLISYGGSSTMARQIEAGAPADVFISASVDWMDEIEKSDRIKKGSRRNLVGNSLVLIAQGSASPVSEFPADLASDLGKDKLAMALVDAVPAGIYGKQALQSLGQWDRLAPHVAQADNVRAALDLVATGAAPFGITYKSDAIAQPKVTAIYTFPDDSHDPIVYPAALTSDSAVAAEFLDYLTSPEAKQVFHDNGFRSR